MLRRPSISPGQILCESHQHEMRKRLGKTYTSSTEGKVIAEIRNIGSLLGTELVTQETFRAEGLRIVEEF